MKRLNAILGSFLIAVSLLINASLVTAVGTNLIANPSVEDVTNNLPSSWSQDKYGKNTSAFSYDSTGHTGGHSVTVKTTSYTSGDAKWYPNAVTVSPNASYTFSDWYKSNLASSVDAVITTTANKTTYKYLGNVASSADWKQSSFTFKTPSNAKQITFYHYFSGVGQLTTDDYSLEAVIATPAPIPTPPVVSLTAPASGASVTGSQSVTASVTSATAVTGVQFKLDGNNLGAIDTTAPYSVNWDTSTATNGSHMLSATATNSANLSTSATNVTVNVANVIPTPPTVAISSPTTGATINGVQSVNASVTSTTAITGVQFKLDGNNLGALDTSAPYSTNWDTASVTNGSHVLTAVATNSSGLSATATNVAVNVQNVVTPPPPAPTPSGPNLIPNPSVDNTANGISPDSWIFSNWGTNTATSSYLNTGHTGPHSVKTEVTSYTNGASNWYYADVPVTSGKTYKYENWYQSNVDTEVDAQVTMNDGTVQYFWIGTVFANTSWTKYSATFTVPAGAKSLAMYQILAKKGYIVSDDYSLSEYTPVPLNRGLVTVSFDDGWINQYTNALPLLQKYNIPATFYIISGELSNQPDYMSATQVKNLNTLGNEIGSHSVTHSDLTTVSQANLINEMANSKTALQNLIGAPVTNMAYPYGAYNANTIAVGSQYYQSQRSVSGGLNTKDNLNITALKIYEVDSNISQAQVKGWIDAAIAQKAWLILVYHEVATSPIDPSDALYTTNPADLDAELAYIKTTGVKTVTTKQALDEILAQL